MKKLIHLFVSFCLFTQVYSQETKPAWTDYSKRISQYSDQKYISGFISEKYVGGETLSEMQDRLKGYARTLLIEGVQVTIKSLITGNVATLNTEVSTEFRQASLSLSKLKITGLKDEIFYDSKSKICYAFSYALKSEIANTYRMTLQQNKQKIELNFKSAVQYANSNQLNDAYLSLFACQILFAEADEAQALLAVMQGAVTADMYLSEYHTLRTQVNQQIQTLKRDKSLDINSITTSMAWALRMQIPTTDKEVRLANFVFQDSKTSSVFAAQLTQSLDAKLAASGFQVIATPILDFSQVKNTIFVSGSYWIEGDSLRIITVVRDLDTRKTIAGCENKISQKWLINNGIAYQPDNYNNIIDDNKKLDNNPKKNTGLLLDLQTNHGIENPVYQEGDTLKIHIKTNKECFVRFVYHAADGKRLLLLDNHKIMATDINKWVEIQQYFECSAPLGAEKLQINAQSQPFKPLNVKVEDGFPFIADDLGVQLSNSRSFKPINDKSFAAEKILYFTTLPVN